MTELLHTPLHDFHVARGAKLVPFAGWEMPVQYPTGVLAEHNHTRRSASLFDVSHMGQVLLRSAGRDAALALETLTPASVAGLHPWRQRYGLFTNDAGGVLDDFMFANHEQHLFLVVNAARTSHDLGLLRGLAGVEVEHVTSRALLAVQGPDAEEQLARLIPEVRELRFMDSRKLDWAGEEAWVSRSGYTGEDGFEVSLPVEYAIEFAERLLADSVVQPAGLGARDSLRLEAGMPLYGHELTERISPSAAALDWSIPKVRRPGGSRAGGYPGASVIERELDAGAPEVRVGLRPEGRAPVRDGVELFADQEATQRIGVVTSGGFGPSVGGPIAMAMLPTGFAPGSTIFAQVRGKLLPVTVTPIPFVTLNYKR